MRTVASWKISAAESTGTSGWSAWVLVSRLAQGLRWECSPALVSQERAIMATVTMTSSGVVKQPEGGALMTTLCEAAAKPGLISVLLLWRQNLGGLESESTASDQTTKKESKACWLKEESDGENQRKDIPTLQLVNIVIHSVQVIY